MDLSTSSDEYVVNLRMWNAELSMSFLVLDIFLVLYIVVGILGNAVIIYIFKWKMKKSLEDRFFILVLGILDAVVCLTSPSIYLALNVLPVLFYNDWACKMSWFVTRTLSNTSGMLILVIAIQRYLKVCRPFGRQMTLYWQKAALTALLICSIIMDIPLLFFYGVIPIHSNKYNVTGFRCGNKYGIEDETMDMYIDIFLYCMFGAAMFVMMGMTLMYVLIGRRIYIQIQKKQSLGPNNTTSTSAEPASTTVYGQDDESSVIDNRVDNDTGPARKSVANIFNKKKIKSRFHHHRYSLMFMTISACCATTYIPSLAVNMAYNMDSAEFFNDPHSWRRSLCFFVFQAYLINHVSNPFIYGFFDTKFREHFKSIFY